MSRIRELDLMRGIAIFLVVLGHTFPPVLKDKYLTLYIGYHFIYNFHMPLFFLISGFLYYIQARKIDTITFIKNKFVQLMIPYIVFSLLTYLGINLAMASSHTLNNVLAQNGYTVVGNFNAFLYSLLTYTDHIDKHIWFIYCLFLIFIIGKCLDEFIGRSNFWTIAIIFLGISFFINLNIGRIFPIVKLTLYHFIFFYIGKYFAQNYGNKNTILIYKTRIILSFMFLNTMMIGIHYCTISKLIDKNIGLLLNKILIYPCSILGVLSTFILVHYISNKVILDKLVVLNKYSYDIYLLHQPFIVSGSIAVLYAVLKLPVEVVVITALTTGIIIPYFISKYILRKSSILSLLFLGKFKKLN
ncbi:acyltransferase [Priestia megaterium]|uniref:acyltransferase family protein n=1 Tax=Priestia megaterium TaxID=1404 RepID=UPI002E1BE6FA|nr:acyltransferase [Priestia megaterium]